MNRRGFAPIFIIALTAAVLIIAGAWYYVSHFSKPAQITGNQSSPSASADTQTTAQPGINGTSTANQSSSSASVPGAITRGDKELVLLTLTGGQTITAGKTYSIQWSWNPDILYYSKVLDICLLGQNGDQNISAISPYNEPMCTLAAGSAKGSYLIATTTITDGVYRWNVPADLLNRFASPPSSLKIELAVFDTRPAGTTASEWAGDVGWSESASSLMFAK